MYGRHIPSSQVGIARSTLLHGGRQLQTSHLRRTNFKRRSGESQLSWMEPISADEGWSPVWGFAAIGYHWRITMRARCRSNGTTAGASLGITSSPSPSTPLNQFFRWKTASLWVAAAVVSLSCMSRAFCPVELFGLAGLARFACRSQRILFQVPAHDGRWIHRTYTSNPHYLAQLSLSFSILFSPSWFLMPQGVLTCFDCYYYTIHEHLDGSLLTGTISRLS